MNSQLALTVVVLVVVAAVDWQLVSGQPQVYQVLVKSFSYEPTEPQVAKRFEVTTADTVRDLKNKIRAATGVPQRKQILVCADSRLEDESRHLWDYNCRAGHEVTLTYNHLGSFVADRFYLESQGRRLPVHFKPRQRVFELKLAIAKSLGIPVEQQKLVYKRMILANGNPLSAYNIEDDDKVELREVASPQGNFVVFVKSYSYDPVPEVNTYIEIHPSDTVAMLKEKIFKRTRVPPKEQSLYLNDVLRDDSKRLEEYKPRPGDEVILNLGRHLIG